MPGINTTGAPNTDDYLLGRGIVRLAKINAATGLPDSDGFRDLGNAPEFTVTVNTEDLRHQNSRDCLKFTDKRFVISQELALSFQLDETRNFDNIADFVSGETASYANPNATLTDVVISASVHLGSWYELRNAAGLRQYGLDQSGLVYHFDKEGSPDVLLVEGTDYEIDEPLGLVRFLPTAVNCAEGDSVSFTIGTAAGVAITIDQVNALTRSEVTGVLLFVQDNAGDCGKRLEFRFHKVSLSSDGDWAQIGDEVSVMNFTGVAEVNSLVTDTSKVLTVREIPD